MELERRGALCSAQVAPILAQLLTDEPGSAHIRPLPEALWLTGFDDINPAQEALLKALNGRGCGLHYFEPQRQVNACLLPCNDEAEELASAAAWAKERLQAEPQARIGWVIPDLPSRKLAVERVLTQVFSPQDFHIQEARHAPGYNISVAEPLGFTPPIAAALHLLNLVAAPADSEDWQLFATSPFIGSEGEVPWRARLLGQITRRYHQITWRRLLSATDAFKGQDAAPSWQQSLTQTLAWRRALPRQRLCIGQWLEHWQVLLAIWHWPGQRQLDTLEYQQLMQWPVLLADVQQLEAVLGPVSFTEALGHLSRLSYRPFAAQTGDSPLQVLGLLEAAGQPFDELWVMGMDGRHWPPPAQPNPLLPIALQRSKLMPRSSHQRELMLAERLTQRLCQAAPRVLVSFSLREGDRPLVPSPLVEHLPLYSGPDVALPSSVAEQLRPGSVPLEAFRDDQGPCLAAQQEGGTQVLKDQAACPFAAFARHRLNAQSVQPLLFGVNPGLRGSLLHSVLFQLWQAWQSQDVLMDLQAGAVEQAIEAALAQSWLELDPFMGVAQRVREIENRRCQRVVNALLEHERQRPPFSVATLEAKQQIQLGQVRLNLRLDRVDRLADGGQVVIDYKSREASHQLWLDERPADPQVPLYCLLTPEVVGGLFAVLEPGKEGFTGLMEAGRDLLGVPAPEQLKNTEISSWPELLTLWQQRLQALADEFSQGIATTTPSPNVCRFCDLASLCRYKERAAGLVAEEVEDA
ncbi:MAG TPA: PD-(D/E)XK nuclease family protein [Cellvibrionaceae bacterium]|nr:PD-(D/E)XK nuclease family protein [Cellvibrionaceae bacterium]